MIKDLFKALGLGGVLFSGMVLVSLLIGGIPDTLATHGSPTQWIEGLHAEGDGFLPSPVLIGGDDGTDVTNILVDTDGHLQVDVIASTASTEYTEDTAHTDASKGPQILTVRDDTPVSATSGASNDLQPLMTDAYGGLYTRLLGLNGAAYDPTDILTKTSHDAALGTAGTADAQVRSIQGVASMTPVLTQPFDAIKEGGSTELVGINFVAMTQNEFSAAKEIALGGTYSGEVVQACLTQSEEGTGAILADIALRLFIFDADPSLSTADTLIATASHLLLLDEVAFANGDFWIDTGAGTLCMQMNTLFHAVSSLWFAIATEGATAINSAAEDDEVVDLNFWYRRDS